MTIIARLRMPVAARFEQARIRALTSSAARGSGGSLRPLLAGKWSMLVEIMVANLGSCVELRFYTEAPFYFDIAWRSG